MLNIRKSPMDMNTNRYEKLVQTPSRGAEGASPDCVTNEQCQSAYRQSIKTTAAEVFMKVADKAEPSRYQGTAVGPRGPEPTVLQMYGVGRLIVILGGRPLGNCTQTVLSLRKRHPHGCHR